MNTPITSLKNQFQGINVLLQEILESGIGTWTWEELHGHHLSDLTAQLTDDLDGMGYTVHMEEGLQIRVRDEQRPRSPESDVIIKDPDPARSRQGAARFPLDGNYRVVSTLDLVADPDQYAETKYFRAISVYEGNKLEGSKPVAWIELLSPSNKPRGTHYWEYLEKRELLLETGELVFCEIDYLRRSSPTILRNFPDYTKQEPGATPYRILITDTRQNRVEGHSPIQESETYVVEFRVDEPIPRVPLPLHGEDIVRFDLQHAYNATYERMRYGRKVPIDYLKLPDTFAEFSSDDQERLLRRLLAVVLATAGGVNLDKADYPLGVDGQDLDEKIARFRHFKQQTRAQDILAQLLMND